MKNPFYFIFLLIAITGYSQNRAEKIHLQKYRKAIAAFNKENDSATAEFYYKRGGIRQDYFDFSGAITDYNKTISMDSQNFKAYYNRGLSKMEIMLFPEAIIDFDKTIKLSPSQEYAYNNRGICKFMQEI